MREETEARRERRGEGVGNREVRGRGKMGRGDDRREERKPYTLG